MINHIFHKIFLLYKILWVSSVSPVSNMIRAVNGPPVVRWAEVRWVNQGEVSSALGLATITQQANPQYSVLLTVSNTRTRGGHSFGHFIIEI